MNMSKKNFVNPEHVIEGQGKFDDATEKLYQY